MIITFIGNHTGIFTPISTNHTSEFLVNFNSNYNYEQRNIKIGDGVKPGIYIHVVINGIKYQSYRNICKAGRE